MTYPMVGRALYAVAIVSALSAGSLFAVTKQNAVGADSAPKEFVLKNVEPKQSTSGATLPSEVQVTVSLEQALARTLDQNPSLAMFSYRLRVADADVLQAGLRPTPAISMEVENVGGNAPYGGVDGAQVTVALSQMIELGGKRDMREDVAVLGASGERLAYETARLDILGETLRRYVELAEAEASVGLAKRAVLLAEKAEEVARRRVKAGAAPQSDITRLTISRQQAELALLHAQVRQRSASVWLALMWGEGRAENLKAASALLPLPALPTRDAVLAQVKQAPLLRSLITQTRLREAQVRLAESSGRGDMTISVGARRDFLSNGNSMVLGLSMPLGSAKANRANIARAQAELQLSQVSRDAGELEILASIDEMYRSLQLTREALLLVEQQSLPLMRQLYHDIEKGYQAGRYSLLELISAQQERLALEQDVIDLAATFHLQRNELERLTGQTFFAAGDQEMKQELNQ